MEPRFNEPLYNEVLGIKKDVLQPGQSYGKMYGTEPRYNENLVITNIILKPKRKIYPDITNKCKSREIAQNPNKRASSQPANRRQKVNAEQTNSDENPLIL